MKIGIGKGDFFEGGGCLLNRGADLQVGANSRIFGARYIWLYDLHWSIQNCYQLSVFGTISTTFSNYSMSTCWI